MKDQIELISCQGRHQLDFGDFVLPGVAWVQFEYTSGKIRGFTNPGHFWLLIKAIAQIDPTLSRLWWEEFHLGHWGWNREGWRDRMEEWGKRKRETISGCGRRTNAYSGRTRKAEDAHD